jgi:Protein of unknown function (DUF1364)
VGAHFRSLSLGAGMGLKNDPIHCAHACHPCHDACDGRRYIDGWTKNDIRLAHAIGVLRTIEWLRESGHIQIGKSESRRKSA